ncbi:3-keto-disaccharide hydrolase, partial [Gimesia maris]|uniref:3-keto-disaccharide hydrolase n=1 Tax=Gimesia maris TaxID=122 RepID=UPI000154307B
MKSASSLTFCLCLFLSLCIGPLASADDTPAEKKWIPLFNGKDLDDWTVKIRGYDVNENFGNTFRVEDGLLKVGYDQYGEFAEKFGHLFYKTPFSHYVIRVEYRFTGEQSTGD